SRILQPASGVFRLAQRILSLAGGLLSDPLRFELRIAGRFARGFLDRAAHLPCGALDAVFVHDVIFQLQREHRTNAPTWAMFPGWEGRTWWCHLWTSTPSV